MSKKAKAKACPECGGVMRYEKRDDILTYKNHTHTLKTLGWWCTKCGEAILTGDALVARERAFHELKAEVDGVLSPDAIKKIRKALGLSQREASALLGGGPHAFQKYEAGRQAASVPMSHLLRLLEKEPKRLEELVQAPREPIAESQRRASARESLAH